MIKIPYDDIIKKIREGSNLSEAEIEAKIKEKMDQLAGLISKEGAAHIIANELGIKVINQVSGKLKIKDILPGMRGVELEARVQQVYEKREFQRADGSMGKVANMLVGDETGVMRIVMWGSTADELSKLKPGDVIRLQNASARDNNGRKELHLSENSKIIINPLDASVEQIKNKRKKISELELNDENIELLGTIVQLYDPTFFEVCPQCGRRAQFREDGGYYCETHGQITPNFSYVFNVVLNDGSEDTVRVVFYKKQAEALLKKTQEEILQFKDNPALYETIKTEYLGKIIKVVGRTKESMFSKLDFVAQLVYPDPDPEEELKKLKEENSSSPLQESSESFSESKPETSEELTSTNSEPINIDDIETIE